MADLPRERIQPSRPFTLTGLDFAGPIITKPDDKTYVAVFVCFATKAVHLELVSSLTKEACLGALKRFTGRRGTPARIYTDNATNFMGARNDLMKLEALLQSNSESSITSFGTVEGLEWVMIPPRAPHFGGLWEAAVRKMKHHLRRVVGKQILTYKELLSYVVQIEAILNSRPLTPATEDPNDLAPLTPGHFLIESPITTVAQRKPENPTSLGQRFRLLQELVNSFWKTWQRDYLVYLQVRKRWLKDGFTFKCGELVLIAEDNQPPLHWKMGRITEIYPGNDEIVRVVKLKTSTGELVRPVVKIRKLPIESSVEEAPPTL